MAGGFVLQETLNLLTLADSSNNTKVRFFLSIICQVTSVKLKLYFQWSMSAQVLPYHQSLYFEFIERLNNLQDPKYTLY